MLKQSYAEFELQLHHDLFKHQKLELQGIIFVHTYTDTNSMNLRTKSALLQGIQSCFWIRITYLSDIDGALYFSLLHPYQLKALTFILIIQTSALFRTVLTFDHLIIVTYQILLGCPFIDLWYKLKGHSSITQWIKTYWGSKCPQNMK